MTVSVSFESPQIQVSNSSDGIKLSQVVLPYSIRNSKDFSQYLGGQMTLGQSDGIKLTDNTKDWERLGLAKIKAMVADAEIYVPEPVVSIPEELPTSSAAEAPVSSASAVSSSDVEAPTSSAESPVSSASVVASSAESQVTTAPSESTTEA